MKVHLVDGTFELFRAHFGGPPATTQAGRSVGATRGLIRTLLSLLREDDVTHVACAFDTVTKSFRNDIFDGYKNGAGIDEELLFQFPLAERVSSALGIVTWPMIEFEADDALATAAVRFANHPEVDQVVIVSPDKDLTQVVIGQRIVSLDRRKGVVFDENGVVAKFGVRPESIPDYLGLVGDTADGIPGIPKWGVKATAAVLHRYGHIEDIPENPLLWDVAVRGAKGLGRNLVAYRREAMLYRDLATLRLDVSLKESLEDLEWRGAEREEFVALCQELGFDRLPTAPHKWVD